MFKEFTKIFSKVIEKLKKKIYGKSFFCPVCHLELSYHDVNEDGLLVCPLCGIVIELGDVFGHPLPVVHDVEIKRVQPKARLHPWATHLPIGLFPFALLGAIFLFVVSILRLITLGFAPDQSVLSAGWAAFLGYMPIINKVLFVFLLLAVAGAVLTFLAGLGDWLFRYEARAYRVITLKIVLSVLFLLFGGIALVLHAGGFVFSSCCGFAVLSWPGILGPLVYLALLSANMVFVATLGHVGGNLVFGK